TLPRDRGRGTTTGGSCRARGRGDRRVRSGTAGAGRRGRVRRDLPPRLVARLAYRRALPPRGVAPGVRHQGRGDAIPEVYGLWRILIAIGHRPSGVWYRGQWP